MSGQSAREIAERILEGPDLQQVGGISGRNVKTVARALIEVEERLEAARVELGRHLCFTNHVAQRDFWTRVEDRASGSSVARGEGRVSDDSNPIFIDGIGPPIQQIAEDALLYPDEQWSKDIRALVAYIILMEGEAVVRAIKK